MRTLTVAVLGVLLVACSGDGAPPPGTGPYVISAVDNHFHDAHPSRPLAEDATVVIRNAGHNLHNVTIPGTDYDRDVRPGDELTIRDIGEFLGGPGRHPFFCKYHLDRGMRGVIVVR